MVIRHGPAGGQYGHDLSALSSGVTSHHSSKGLRTARGGGAGTRQGETANNSDSKVLSV